MKRTKAIKKDRSYKIKIEVIDTIRVVPFDISKTNNAIAVTRGPTSRIFSQFIAISHLDNKAAIRYLNPACLNDNENCRWVSDPTTYWDSTGYSAQP